MQPFHTSRVIKSMEQRRTTYTTQELQDLAIPIAELKPHSVQLKQALLAASRTKHTPNITKWRVFMTKKRLALAGATLALAIVASTAFVALNGNNRTASAQELTRQSLSAVNKLPPDQQKALDKQVSGGAITSLQEAEKAKDLTAIAYDEFEHLLPNATTTKDPSSETDLHQLRYLRYTDEEGTTHAIGINKNGIPVIGIAFRGTPGHAESGAMGSMNETTTSGNPTPGSEPASDCKTTTGGGTVCSGSGGTSAEEHHTSNNQVTEGQTCTTASEGTTTCTPVEH